LLVAIGYGKVSALQMAEKLVNAEKKEPASRVSMGSVTGLLGDGFDKVTSFAKKIVGQKSSSSGVSIAGINDVLVRFGRCCNPVPGDSIIGFITRGRGVTVHALGCPKALSTDPDRRVDVEWNVDEGFKRRVSLRLLTINRPGVLADISNTFSKRDVNISQANCRSTGDERAVNTFEVGVRDVKQLNELMRSLEKLEGVFSVERL
jgi:GTP pyrophosphokinase